MSKKMLGDIMRQAQKLQEEMMKKQEEAKTKTVEATAGGGMVTAARQRSRTVNLDQNRKGCCKR